MKTKISSIAAFLIFAAFIARAGEITDTFQVKGGDCFESKNQIESAALNVIGVSMANWNSEKQVLRVIFDESKTEVAYIKKAVAKAGYDTVDFKAKVEVFNKLPDCCKYERDQKSPNNGNKERVQL